MLRIQVIFNNDSQNILNFDEIKKLVEKSLESGRSDSITVKSTMTDNGLSKLVKDISGLAGVLSCSRQTLSHPFGLGGMFGHGIEIKLDEKKAPTIQWLGNESDDGFIVNTEHFLKQFTICEKSQRILDEIFEGDFEDMASYLESINEELNYSGDNTYNVTSDLSNDLHFHSPSLESFEKSDSPLPVFVRKHLGGDPRGNYESARVYLMDYDDYLNFLQVHFGFYSEGYDNYTSGYTSEPQYSFFKDFEILERKGYEVKAKNKKTGEIVEFSCDVNF
jgi:hypothetical protein